MSVVDSKYDRLFPRGEILQDQVILAQAWKKTHTFIRRHNWYADVLELDASSVCLAEYLTKWSNLISSGRYETSPAWLVPAPKNGLWCFKNENSGGWQPRLSKEGDHPVLRPLAHIAVREQTIATAVMLCLADCIESAQGDTSLSSLDASRRGVYSYGNRLFCDWKNNHKNASYAWGNSNTYSRYFQDYQKFVERPVAIASSIETDENEVLYVVSLDISAFFDNVDIDLLIEKLKAEYDDFIEKSDENLKPSDDFFWEIAHRALSFSWREEDKSLKNLFRKSSLPMGLPQGLVASGFFANAYLLEFDRAIGRFIDLIPKGRNFRIHDYCRYVDDLRLVISVEHNGDTPNDLDVLASEVSTWVQSLLKKHTTPAGKIQGYLRLNTKKTQLDPYAESGQESGTAATMKSLQRQLSGPFDLDSLRQVEAGLNGLLSLAELGLIEDNKQPDGALKLATIAALKLEVRDDTLTRFSAYRLVRSLRQRRTMTDITDFNDGEITKVGLANDYQAAARRLVSLWAVNPSLVQVLRYAMDLYPSTELLEPIEQALMSKIENSDPDSNFGRRVAYYVLADLFKAGATETGKAAEQDVTFQVANITD